uniref:C-terminal of Roc, COR, domain n=1 Tax=Candidatus Kentrum sp. TUN TaxID=2126343 RepID=A0A450ZQ12_9GAMM|nr:MAG: C-terminal of Roc, COR, domain [Candidatus Kentron sp. TUN]
MLDQLGEVIHFPALYKAGFRAFLLNPRWLTHGIYQLLYSDVLQDAEGILRWNDVRAILKDRSIVDEQGNRLIYPEEKLDFLLRAMVEFRLCYPAPHASGNIIPGNTTNKKWIVPNLLPSDQPQVIDFDRQGALRFDFQFETFLPRHVLGMFMVEHYRDIRNNQAWQHGVCLESRQWGKTQALVRADYQSRVLALAITGPHVNQYFPILYKSILEILERMPKLSVTKRLHLDEKALIRGGREYPGEEPTEDFENLLAVKATGAREFSCKLGIYDLQALFRPIPKEMESESAFEWKATGSLWEILSGLGGLVAIISGVVAWFKKFPQLPDSLGMALIAIGGVMSLGALIVWLWRRGK